MYMPRRALGNIKRRNFAIGIIVAADLPRKCYRGYIQRMDIYILEYRHTYNARQLKLFAFLEVFRPRASSLYKCRMCDCVLIVSFKSMNV